MDRENIMFFKNQDKSYTVTDLYVNLIYFLGIKILRIIMILMLKYYL